MQNLNPVDNYLHGSWEALGSGAPTLVALAQLCSENWVRRAEQTPRELEDLSPESQAILFAAKDRGIIEIRAVNTAFDAAARLLAVYVEVSDERTIAFRDPAEPAITLSFLEAFRDLCQQGLIIHHIFRDFTLAPAAFGLAAQIQHAAVSGLLAKATEFGLHD